MIGLVRGAPTTSKTTAKNGRKGQEGLEEAIRQSLEALQERMAHDNQDPQTCEHHGCWCRIGWKMAILVVALSLPHFAGWVGVAIVAPTRHLGKIWKNLSAFQVFQSFS